MFKSIYSDYLKPFTFTSAKEQDLIYGFFKKLSKRTNRNFDGGKFETYAQKLKIKADYDNHK